MTDQQTQEVADRLAVADVVVRYFELVDTKRWDDMHEVFTDDTTARWTADNVIEGRDAVVGAMRHMSGSSEIVTYHHVAAMTPVIDGDRAEVVVRVRAMHHGVGPRREPPDVRRPIPRRRSSSRPRSGPTCCISSPGVAARSCGRNRPNSSARR